MKLLNNIFLKTCLGKFFSFIGSLYSYIKIYGYISDTLYSEAFLNLIKKYLNVDLKKDWLGRLYGVINPAIDINGHFDMSNMIFEIDGKNTNNNEYVTTWIYKQLNMISTLFKGSVDKLYNYISFDFKHVGPINGDNYLLVFDITSRKEMVMKLKSFIIHFLIYIIIALIIFLIIF